MAQLAKKPALPSTFEKAMERLEKIVGEMESGELPLEELIIRYEEGMKLVKVCQERLSAAEQRIEIISRDSAGKTVVKEFEATTVAPAPVSETIPPSKGEPDDITLF